MRKYLYRKENEIFVQILVDFRTKKGLRQVDLAKKLNVPQSYVSKIEIGQRHVSILELREICKKLNITLVDFSKILEEELIKAKL